VALDVLPHAPYLLDGAAGVASAADARDAMARRLEASYVDSASQIRKRLLELGAVLRRIR
jgi:hypothetical protein